MLRAEQRLRRSRDFTRAVRGGRRGQQGMIVVHLSSPRPGSGDGPVRVGFVIPRTVGGAVVRNLVRRRLRHVAHDLIRESSHRLAGGIDMVVRVLPGGGAVAFAQLSADLIAAVDRARLGKRAAGREIGGSR